MFAFLLLALLGMAVDYRNETMYFSIIPTTCWENIMVNHNIFDVECIFFIGIKAAGLAMSVFALLVKTPQIIKIFKNKSVACISETNTVIDLLSCAISFIYLIKKSSPFTVYGDSLMIAITVCVLLVQIWYYDKSTKYVLPKTILISGLISFLYTAELSAKTWNVIIMLSIPCSCLGRVKQFFINYKHKSTGELSEISLFLAGFGSLAKFVTLCLEIKEEIVYLLCYLVLVSLNLLIFFQCLYYKRQKAKERTQ
jgi:mannose-P-dolichol utilization defect protein 1